MKIEGIRVRAHNGGGGYAPSAWFNNTWGY